MPIFEYECARCGQVSSHVVLGRRKRERRSCPGCHSTRLRRVMSRFAVVESEASRLQSFDTSKPRDETFYRDSRNVGLWAKKRAAASSSRKCPERGVRRFYEHALRKALPRAQCYDGVEKAKFGTAARQKRKEGG